MAGPTLLVLAAGSGSRYGGVKVMEPVGPAGETLLEYSLYDARQAGFAKIVFVIRRDMDHALKDTLGARLIRNFAIEHTYQDLIRIPRGYQVPPGRSKPWGTTHAVVSAANHLGEPFAVMNVDDFYGAESYSALARHLQAGSRDCAMVGYLLRNTLPQIGPVARAICQIDEKACLKEIVEYKNVECQGGHAVCVDAAGQQIKLSGGELVSMNLWGFQPDILPLMAEKFESFLKHHGGDADSECVLPTVINDLIIEGKIRVKVLSSPDSWFGITYREDHSRVARSIRHMIDAGYYPRRLWA